MSDNYKPYINEHCVWYATHTASREGWDKLSYEDKDNIYDNDFGKYMLANSSGFSGFPFKVVAAHPWKGEWKGTPVDTEVALSDAHDPVKIVRGWKDGDYNGDKWSWKGEIKIPKQIRNGVPQGVWVPDDHDVESRAIVGDGTGYIGPFTLSDAVRILWTAKQTEIVSVDGSAHATLPDLGSADTITGSLTGSQLVNDPAELNNIQKNEREKILHFDIPGFSKVPPSDSGHYGCYMTACFDLLATQPYCVACDISTNSKESYYINVNTSATIGAGGAADGGGCLYLYKDAYIRNNWTPTWFYKIEDDKTGACASQDKKPQRGWFVYNTSQDYCWKLYGSSWNTEHTICTDKTCDNCLSISPISGSTIFEYFQKKITIKLKGFNTMYTNFGCCSAVYDRCDEVTAEISPTTTIKAKIKEYWPYATRNGNPVWNTQTGMQLNEPIS